VLNGLQVGVDVASGAPSIDIPQCSMRWADATT
jgi:hypothetical protein